MEFGVHSWCRISARGLGSFTPTCHTESTFNWNQQLAGRVGAANAPRRQQTRGGPDLRSRVAPKWALLNCSRSRLHFRWCIFVSRRISTSPLARQADARRGALLPHHTLPVSSLVECKSLGLGSRLSHCASDVLAGRRQSGRWDTCTRWPRTSSSSSRPPSHGPPAFSSAARTRFGPDSSSRPLDVERRSTGATPLASPRPSARDPRIRSARDAPGRPRARDAACRRARSRTAGASSLAQPP